MGSAAFRFAVTMSEAMGTSLSPGFFGLRDLIRGVTVGEKSPWLLGYRLRFDISLKKHILQKKMSPKFSWVMLLAYWGSDTYTA